MLSHEQKVFVNQNNKQAGNTVLTIVNINCLL